MRICAIFTSNSSNNVIGFNAQSLDVTRAQKMKIIMRIRMFGMYESIVWRVKVT